LGDPNPFIPLRQVTLATFQLKVNAAGTITGARGSPQMPTSLTPAVAIIIRADDANAATINWGMGNNASDPLAKGESASLDLPPGYFFDVSQLCVSGTAGDSIHIVAAVIEGIPPGS
jgi:hypothetical protein